MPNPQLHETSRSLPFNDPGGRFESLARVQPRILIIGAGISGMLLLIKLREAGFADVTIFEKASAPGGTWRDNTYPGLRCDIPSHMFTYSFEPNPDYRTRFPAGVEIRDYLNRIFDKHQLASAVEFNRAVTACRWHDDQWIVESEDGKSENFDFILSATGILHTPQYPNIPGRENFNGTSFHTARWDHSTPLTERRIGVIGSGATAVQVVPELVRRGSQVVLFQRTPQWIFPMPNRAYSDTEMERVRTSPKLAERLRARYSKIFQWTFTRAVVGNPILLWAIESMCRSHLRRKVKDLDLRAKLTPKSRAGCKRLIFGKGFYQALQYPNAQLVTERIAQIEGDGIRTDDGKLHPLDTIVYATGFQAHNYIRPVVVQGREGITLDDAWANGAYSHRSTSIPGFPNFLMVFGPYSPIGNYSAISVAEVQCGYIIQQLKSLTRRNMQIIEPRSSTTKELLAKMKKALTKTVWLSGCASWYMDEQGNVPMWPWTFERYAKDLSKLDETEFHYSRRVTNEMEAIRQENSIDAQ